MCGRSCKQAVDIQNPHSKQSVITLRNLMSHCSGIVDQQEIYLSEYHYGQDSPVELGYFLENYLSKNGNYYSNQNFSKQKPGEEFLYSNIGSALAAYIVEIISVFFHVCFIFLFRRMGGFVATRLPHGIRRGLWVPIGF